MTGGPLTCLREIICRNYYSYLENHGNCRSHYIAFYDDGKKEHFASLSGGQEGT